ncbi:homeobox protein Rhox13-like [Onychomys torridus]|uniref:homeobox protein Rhox13-like n=1 Tax=Onychomys torridus TaxID=38674 RepID=UPI00167F8691|nr:homeobox protein Rhox13-like [Onychomys torridus]
MARKVHWEYIYVVRDENGEEIAEVSTLEAALAMVGGNPSGGDAGCSMDQNNKAHQVPQSRDPNSSFLEPPQEPGPSAEPMIPIPRRLSSRRRRRTSFKLTMGQVEKMKNLFKKTQYPDVLARKELAQDLNVTKVKEKAWFVNQRAEERNSERSVMLQNIHPRIEKILLIVDRDDYP